MVLANTSVARIAIARRSLPLPSQFAGDGGHMAQDALVRESAAAVAMRRVRRSTGQWFDVARNIIEFDNLIDAHTDLANRKRCRRFR
ncbi:hypothetical protein A5779_10350 [Mycolicibacterium peregrinum]|uniref:Uncharacterized protein n=1 Tax=Mycolicibacterium peregrinum TaxID=43304 RepID=A0A1A0VEA4_MYCPR|nr:hypothetical protein A5779_10350 [Mycolicibacterium peregrinum]